MMPHPRVVWFGNNNDNLVGGGKSGCGFSGNLGSGCGFSGNMWEGRSGCGYSHMVVPRTGLMLILMYW